MEALLLNAIDYLMSWCRVGACFECGGWWYGMYRNKNCCVVAKE